MADTSVAPTIFTATSAYSLAFVAVVGVVAYVSANALLPKNARWQDRFTWIWLAFDAMIHFTFEGSFLYLSTFGRQVNTSVGPFAELWKEYARADARWGFSDPTVVSLEILTVLGAGPLCCYILKQLAQDDPARHYWIVVLSTAELYGGWMTFCPEWLTGSQYLNTSNVLYLWVYLVVSAIVACASIVLIYHDLPVHEHDVSTCSLAIHALADPSSSWVFIPLWLMYDSYGYIAHAIRGAQAAGRVKKN
ncbi:hypothetical protein WOLCODRAFT_88478 [Wolfiporia cocos MD-104 SS10]|uniref:EXPERA domain-containing protein n=1 Tax=Wolfiporia cocos (strain MD-104) TaxID=742152 RepID=A0A2H3JJS8_WOLCO|nr:hypothetical protein WOLCODRAFT_88478 [Wolfiporia cocos MD-104 SS10]